MFNTSPHRYAFIHMFDKWRSRSDCTSVKSDQDLHCADPDQNARMSFNGYIWGNGLIIQCLICQCLFINSYLNLFQLILYLINTCTRLINRSKSAVHYLLFNKKLFNKFNSEQSNFWSDWCWWCRWYLWCCCFFQTVWHKASHTCVV